jgi:5'(3')-deoxyribonucleotidase
MKREEDQPRMKKQTVYLDMDGTIADLYNQPNWLERLIAEDPTPFVEAEPMVSETVLLKLFPSETYQIKILSMTPKNATQKYCEQVKTAKNNWLDKYFPNIKMRIYKPYGNNKNLANAKNHILIDDNETIRNNYKGRAINPSELW